MASGPAGLYRENALRQQAMPRAFSEGLTLVGSGARLAVVLSLAVCAAGLAASVLISVPISVSGRGILLEKSGVGVVSANTQGRVTKVYVTEGQSIRAGDILAEVAQDDLKMQVDDARAQVEAAQRERARALEGMQRTRNAYRIHDETRRAAAQRLIQVETENLERLNKRQRAQEKLARDGFVSAMSLIDSEQDIIASKRRLDELREPLVNADTERRGREAEDAQRQLELDLRVEDAGRKLAEFQAQFERNRHIISAREGTVASVRVARGDVVGSDTQIITLLPAASAAGGQGTVIAYMFVPADSGTQVRIGMPARVVPTAVNPQEFGYMLGKVRHISTLPVGEEELTRLLRSRALVDAMLRDGPAVQVEVELTRAGTPSGYQWSSSNGPAMRIDHGTELGGTVQVGHERLATLAFPFLKPLLP